MISIRKWFDDFRGAGEAAVTVPSMDGALKPNNLLNRADVVWNGGEETVANLTADGDRVLFSRGRQLFVLEANASEPRFLHDCDGQISAIASHASGALAIAIAGKGVYLRRSGGEQVSVPMGQAPVNCPVAIAFESADSLVVANGSASNTPGGWCRDLMEKNRSGSVWRIDIRNGQVKLLADGLGFPAGLIVTDTGDIILSESWRHQLLRLRAGATPAAILDDLPGYPGSISRDDLGAYWLCIYAPRRQLIELVLREESYRKAMLDTLEERHWVAPALKTGIDYFEPVQSGSVRHLGIVKPWAPTRSYGLLVRLDDAFNPQGSYHSRADANRHGITSAAGLGDRVLLTCAATNQLLALDPAITED